MANGKDSILQKYPKEITHILKATTADPKDEAGRVKVATILSRSMSLAKRRTGEDRTPVETEVYKLATVIRQAKTREQFDALIKDAVPKVKSGILEKYDLAWKPPWAAEKESAQKKTRGRRAKKAEVSEAPAPDVSARIDALEKAMNRIENLFSDVEAKIESSGTKKLTKQLEEVLQKLKAHQHGREDGRAYIVERKEI